MFPLLRGAWRGDRLIHSTWALPTKHRLGQNSILSRVKTILIAILFTEKKPRLEVASGFLCIYQ